MEARGAWRLDRRVWVVLATTVIVVGGWSYRWIADDAMIDFRIVNNLLHGSGPVFNVGERVEVYTNPLWVAVLAVGRGLLFFLPWGTVAVTISLLFIAAAVVVAGLLPHNRSRDSTSIPLGLLMLCSLPPMWEFATSGLETSLTFLWISVSSYAVIRRPLRTATALWLGLGPLIRPDLGLIAIVLVVMICVGVNEESDRGSLRLRQLGWSALPLVGYEIFRIGYFGILVSNTALTKSATSLRLDAGWRYFWDFASAYWFMAPFSLLVGWWLWVHRPWRRASEFPLQVRLALLLAGVLHMAYVVAIGGDFMHARMLLPGLFAVGIAIELPVRKGSAVVGAAVGIYIVILVTSLRYEQRLVTSSNFVADERIMTMSLTKVSHPVNPHDMRQSIWWQYGRQLRQESRRGPNASSTRLALSSSPNAYFGRPSTPIRFEATSLPEPTRLVAASRPIGQVGLAAGSEVSIFDQLSLANPVSSHFTLRQPRTDRPGHEKVATFAWYLGRYGSPRLAWWSNYYQPAFRYEVVTAKSIRDAGATLRCGALHRYLVSIASPLTPRVIAGNFRHALTWTTMSYSSDPSIARSQLCSS